MQWESREEKDRKREKKEGSKILFLEHFIDPKMLLKFISPVLQRVVLRVFTICRIISFRKTL
jgi:hypothetical protein